MVAMESRHQLSRMRCHHKSNHGASARSDSPPVRSTISQLHGSARRSSRALRMASPRRPTTQTPMKNSGPMATLSWNPPPLAVYSITRGTTKRVSLGHVRTSAVPRAALGSIPRQAPTTGPARGGSNAAPASGTCFRRLGACLAFPPVCRETQKLRPRLRLCPRRRESRSCRHC